MKGRSLNGTDEQIKLRALITESERTGVHPETICQYNTKMNVDQYLERPFNRLGYYQYQHQMHTYKQARINFWDL